MFEYEICANFDSEIFAKQCKALEDHIPNLHKSKYLEDVDGSQIQIYTSSNNAEIQVINDKLLGIEVHSDEELTHYFK